MVFSTFWDTITNRTGKRRRWSGANGESWRDSASPIRTPPATTFDLEHHARQRRAQGERAERNRRRDQEPAGSGPPGRRAARSERALVRAHSARRVRVEDRIDSLRP